jgi:SAM-dependent methyltransferase
MHDMRFHPETACPDVGAADRFAVVARRTHVGAGARRTIERQATDRGQKLVSSHYWPDVPPGDLVDGVRCEDIERPTFRDGSFDLVVSSDVFEHIIDVDAALGQIARVLDDGTAAARRRRGGGVPPGRPSVEPELSGEGGDGPAVVVEHVQFHPRVLRLQVVPSCSWSGAQQPVPDRGTRSLSTQT